MQLEAFIDKLRGDAGSVTMDEALLTIAEAYEVTPVGYTLGEVRFELPRVHRSCQLYAFGLLNGLTKEQTLACFGDHYREVLDDPRGSAHQTIRLFMSHGWAGLKLDGMPLKRRTQS